MTKGYIYTNDLCVGCKTVLCRTFEKLNVVASDTEEVSAQAVMVEASADKIKNRMSDIV